MWTLLLIIALLLYLMFFWNPGEKSAAEPKELPLPSAQASDTETIVGRPDQVTNPAKPGWLTCPYCAHQFPLTWSRYLKSPIWHTCPACLKPSHFPVTVATVGHAVAFIFVVGTPCGLLFQSCFDWPLAWMIGGAIGPIVFAIPLGKFYDSRFRKLGK